MCPVTFQNTLNKSPPDTVSNHSQTPHVESQIASLVRWTSEGREGLADARALVSEERAGKRILIVQSEPSQSYTVQNSVFHTLFLTQADIALSISPNRRWRGLLVVDSETRKRHADPAPTRKRERERGDREREREKEREREREAFTLSFFFLREGHHTFPLVEIQGKIPRN